MEKLDGKSMDLEKHSIKKIKELFPEVVTEGRIDFDKLRLILGDEVDDSIEKYQFTWNGKSQTIKLAQKPSTGTLRPAKEESKNWDTTDNLYIEGDNLEVLKQLQKTYFGKIKMIYIDPPYNTGGDFVYKDDFKDSIKNYKEQTNQISRSNADTSGRYHTDWLNMMYSRLMLAKNLLSDDGVIFISIDDNELHNLIKLTNEIFGEIYFVGIFKWNKTAKAPSLSKRIRNKYEYIIAYSFDSKMEFFGKDSYNTHAPLLNPTNNVKKVNFRPGTVVLPNNFDKGFYSEKFKVELLNDVIVKNGFNKNEISIEGKFKWSQEKINAYIEEGYKFLIKKDFSTIYYELNQNGDNFIAPSDVISKEEVGIGKYSDSKIELSKLNIPFDYAKPVSLIKYLVNMIAKFDMNLTIVDFFSGSATTAHAVMKLNAEDGGKRKFIMVQLPEKTDDKSEAYKAGYKNICEIGKERIRRAGEQIKQEMKKEEKDSSKLDTGFKVFKFDDTNIKEWDSSQEVTQSTLFDQKEVFKEGRTTEDVLYEILLKYGVFDMPVSETLINDKVAYDIGRGDMIVALFDDITSEDIKAIAEKKPRAVIFKDSGFANDNVKLNALHNLEKQGVEDIKSI